MVPVFNLQEILGESGCHVVGVMVVVMAANQITTGWEVTVWEGRRKTYECRLSRPSCWPQKERKRRVDRVLLEDFFEWVGSACMLSCLSCVWLLATLGGSAGKESSCNADLGSMAGLERSPGEGKGYPLQYSGLENSMDCIIHRVTKSQTQLSYFHLHCHFPCKHMDCIPPGSSVLGIFLTRIPEWISISYSRGSSWARDRTHVSYVSCIARRVIYH